MCVYVYFLFILFCHKYHVDVKILYLHTGSRFFKIIILLFL